MTIYSVAPDHADTPYLWRSESEDDQYPLGLAFLTSAGNTAVTNHADDHGVVFRAAAAVLAPDEAVVDLIAATLWEAPSDDVAVRTPWSRAPLDIRHTYRREAELVLAALRRHATGEA